MKFLFMILAFSSFNAQAQYHRFYRGYALPELKDFITVVNRDFFPLFPKAGPEGLISYKPILLNETKIPSLPQEIVLLTFKNEDVYKTYGTSEIGKTIRAAHAPVFDANKSKSLVPVPFSGTVAPETAYLMNPDFKAFTSGSTGVLIQAEPFGAPDSTLKEVEKIFKSTGKQNSVSLVAEDYVVEYLFAANEAELDKLRSKRCSQFKGAFKTNKFIVLKKHKVGERTVNYGEGLDAQW